MKYIDDNGEVQKYNIKDLAKSEVQSELKKKLTKIATVEKNTQQQSNGTVTDSTKIQVNIGKETVKTGINQTKKKIKSEIKSNTRKTTKYLLTPSSSDDQSEISKQSDQTINRATTKSVKAAKDISKIRQIKREIKTIDRFDNERILSVTKKQKKDNTPFHTSQKANTTLKRKLQQRSIQKKLYQDITGKKYIGSNKNLENSLKNVFFDYGGSNIVKMKMKKKATLYSLIAGIVIIPMIWLLIFIACIINPVQILAESDEPKRNLQQEISRLEAGYYDQQEKFRIQNGAPMGEFILRFGGGCYYDWREVVSIYYVIAQNNGDRTPFEFDDTRDQALMEVVEEMYPFTSMSSLDWKIEDIQGSESSGEITYILPHVTPEEMFELHNFSENNIKTYNNLISSDNDEYWNVILAGTNIATTNRMVSLALSQLGNTGRYYVESTGLYGGIWISDHEVNDDGSRGTPWCGVFISWLVKQCGYEDILPISASACDFANFYSKSSSERKSQLHIVKNDTGYLDDFLDPDYIPVPGDIVVYKLKADKYDESTGKWSYASHVGMVVDVQYEVSETDVYEYTIISGNSSVVNGEATVSLKIIKDYDLGKISCFIHPNYPSDNTEIKPVPSFDFNCETYSFDYTIDDAEIILSGNIINGDKGLSIIKDDCNTDNPERNYNAYCIVGDELPVADYGINTSKKPITIKFNDDKVYRIYIGFKGWQRSDGRNRRYIYFCVCDKTKVKSNDTVYALIRK